MKVFGGSRMNGKTGRLIEAFLADPDGVFVTFNHDAARMVKERVPEERRKYVCTPSGLDLLSVILAGKGKSVLYIDELPLVLPNLLSVKVGGIALCASGPASSADANKFARDDEQMKAEFPVEFWAAKGGAS